MKKFSKQIALILFFAVSFLTTSAQPTIQWQKTFGGTYTDDARYIRQTSDGGFVVTGYSMSNDGNVTGNHGNKDYWVAKLDSIGALLWQKSIGGTSIDWAFAIQQTSKKGYIIAGESNSIDGDVVGNNGGFDFFIVKLDSLGNILWKKSFGGSLNDHARDIKCTSDGGYIVGGYTQSKDGDVGGNHGGIDYWIIKTDSVGTLQWQKTLGGTGDDWGSSVQQTTDSGFIVVGESPSNNGDVTGNHGGEDFWVVKLNTSGAIQWQKSYGGSNNDVAKSVYQTTDDGYIICGYTSSYDGDVTGYQGNKDYWIIKIDSGGVLQWQKACGGSLDDWALSIQQISNGYIVTGYSESYNGDVTGNHGNADYWVVKLDNYGSIQWQKTLGGGSNEHALSIEQTYDGGYIVAGFTDSNEGDVTGNHGSSDYWVVKLSSTAGIDALYNNGSICKVYPNPATSNIFIEVHQNNIGSAFSISDILGQVIMTGQVINDKSEINISCLTSGFYFLTIGSNLKQTIKLVIQ